MSSLIDVNLVNYDGNATFLSMNNKGPSDVWLAGPRVTTPLDGHYFEFDAPVTFLGKTEDRLGYDPQELLRLAPGAPTSWRVDLENLYKLDELRDSVQIRYRAQHSLAGADFPLEELASPWIRIPAWS